MGQASGFPEKQSSQSFQVCLWIGIKIHLRVSFLSPQWRSQHGGWDRKRRGHEDQWAWRPNKWTKEGRLRGCRQVNQSLDNQG